jgi:hypothetical protein
VSFGRYERKKEAKKKNQKKGSREKRPGFDFHIEAKNEFSLSSVLPPIYSSPNQQCAPTDPNPALKQQTPVLQ